MNMARHSLIVYLKNIHVMKKHSRIIFLAYGWKRRIKGMVRYWYIFVPNLMD
jgi:hypothetical protein